MGKEKVDERSKGKSEKAKKRNRRMKGEERVRI